MCWDTFVRVLKERKKEEKGGATRIDEGKEV